MKVYKGFTLGWLKLEESLFLHELDAFRDYISNSEKSIKEIQATFEKEWDEEVAKNPEAKDELHLFFEDEISKKFRLIPHIAYSSLFISLSSLFESAMKKASTVAGHKTLSWKDMSGNRDFDKVRSYLTKVILVDLTPIDRPWQKAMEFYKLRNRIVHNGSEVDVESGLIKDRAMHDLFTKYSTSLHLQNDGHFYVTSTVILHDFLETIKDVIVGLYNILIAFIKALS